MDGLDNSLPPPPPLPIPSANPPATPQRRSLTQFNKISIVIIALVILVVGGYLLTSRTQQPSGQKDQPPTVPAATGTNPNPQTTAPAAPTGLQFLCDSANNTAVLSWDAVPQTDFYLVHVRGDTSEDTRVYATTYKAKIQDGTKTLWWIEAVNHNADFSKANTSASVGGPDIKC